MAVRYYTDDCTYRLPQKRLTAAWLDRVAREEGYELGDVTYIFCSAARLLDMNRQFLGHDYYTDVITFDYSDRFAPSKIVFRRTPTGQKESPGHGYFAATLPSVTSVP